LIIERLGEFETYGPLRIYRPIRVLEIDGMGAKEKEAYRIVNYNDLEKIAEKTAIVVPIKNEPLIKLRGVLSGIPHVSPIIIISASSRDSVDHFKDEIDIAKDLHRRTGRKIILAWQRDSAWAEALKGTPHHTLLDPETNLVRYGKGEGMLLSVMLAGYFGMKYIGFIDSDNFSPGSVHEYAWTYYAGFIESSSDLSLIRLKWPYKGKLEGADLPYLRLRGRVSTHTNDVLNYAISLIKKIETDIIQTANSGEHAITMKLAQNIEWAGGYAVEPYQLVYLLQNCWLSEKKTKCPSNGERIHILQIETRSPHIHAERGESHVISMLKTSLSTILYSELNNEHTEGIIREIIKDYTDETGVPRPRIYPPPSEEWSNRIVKVFEGITNDLVVFE